MQGLLCGHSVTVCTCLALYAVFIHSRVFIHVCTHVCHTESVCDVCLSAFLWKWETSLVWYSASRRTGLWSVAHKGTSAFHGCCHRGTELSTCARNLAPSLFLRGYTFSAGAAPGEEWQIEAFRFDLLLLSAKDVRTESGRWLRRLWIQHLPGSALKCGYKKKWPKIWAQSVSHAHIFPMSCTYSDPVVYLAVVLIMISKWLWSSGSIDFPRFKIIIFSGIAAALGCYPEHSFPRRQAWCQGLSSVYPWAGLGWEVVAWHGACGGALGLGWDCGSAAAIPCSSLCSGGGRCVVLCSGRCEMGRAALVSSSSVQRKVIPVASF